MKMQFVFLFVLFLFSSCSTMQRMQQMQKGTLQNHHFSNTVQLSEQGGLYFLPVEINGIKKNFLLSIGHEISVLDAAFAQSINLQKLQDDPMAKINNLYIGKCHFADTYLSIQDLAHLRSSIDNFGGILGQSLLQKSNFLLDLTNKEITFTDQKSLFKKDLKKYTLPLKYDHTQIPSLQFKTDGRYYLCHLNSLSSKGIVLPQSRKDAQRLLDENPILPQTVNTNLYERPTLSTRILLPEASLGHQLTLADLTIEITETEQGFIGLDFLKNYRLFFDHTRDEIQIHPIAKNTNAS